MHILLLYSTRTLTSAVFNLVLYAKTIHMQGTHSYSELMLAKTVVVSKHNTGVGDLGTRPKHLVVWLHFGCRGWERGKNHTTRLGFGNSLFFTKDGV